MKILKLNLYLWGNKLCEINGNYYFFVWDSELEYHKVIFFCTYDFKMQNFKESLPWNASYLVLVPELRAKTAAIGEDISAALLSLMLSRMIRNNKKVFTTLYALHYDRTFLFEKYWASLSLTAVQKLYLSKPSLLPGWKGHIPCCLLFM